MKTINERLDTLFAEWEAALECEGFKRDGILNKLGRSVEWVEDEWNKSPRRVCFLLKDNPDEGNDDVRNWLVNPAHGEANRKLKPRFLRRIALLLYGLVNISKERDVWFGEIDECQLVETFNNVPVAFVETKKTSGATSIRNKEMRAHIMVNANWLRRELEILRPNIIVCCGSPQYEFALRMLFGEDVRWAIDSHNVKYHEDTRTLVVYAPHPSCRASYAKYYEDTIYHYRNFLKEHPNILQTIKS